jgi:hypothetical protein
MLELKEAGQTVLVSWIRILFSRTSTLKLWVPKIENNLFRFFDACRDKEIVLFPYAFQ